MSSEFHELDRQRVWIDHPYSILSLRNGSDTGDSLVLHHITGRAGKHKDSIFNSARLLNHEENIAMHGKLHTKEVTEQLLQKVARHVFKVIKAGGYEMQERDKLFLYEQREFYNKDNIRGEDTE